MLLLKDYLITSPTILLLPLDRLRGSLSRSVALGAPFLVGKAISDACAFSSLPRCRTKAARRAGRPWMAGRLAQCWQRYREVRSTPSTIFQALPVSGAWSRQSAWLSADLTSRLGDIFSQPSWSGWLLQALDGGQRRAGVRVLPDQCFCCA